MIINMKILEKLCSFHHDKIYGCLGFVKNILKFN